MKENTDLFDVYASANEDLFNMVDTDLMKLKYKIMRFNQESNAKKSKSTYVGNPYTISRRGLRY